MFNHTTKKLIVRISVLIFGIGGTAAGLSHGTAMEQNQSLRNLENLNTYIIPQSVKKEICTRFTNRCKTFYLNNNQFDRAHYALAIINGFNLNLSLDLDILHTLIILSVGQKMPERIQFISDYRKPCDSS